MQKEQSFEVKSGAQDRVEGVARQAVGKFKVCAAQVVGSPRLRAEGDIDQIVGDAQRKIGEIKKALGK